MESKLCEWCGREFTRRQPTYWISPKDWPARRYCSELCRRKAMAARNVQLGAEGRHPADKHEARGDGANRVRARQLYPELGPCEVCGGPASDRHHRDENTFNNAPENIAFLCRGCHTKHHAPQTKRRDRQTVLT